MTEPRLGSRRAVESNLKQHLLQAATLPDQTSHRACLPADQENEMSIRDTDDIPSNLSGNEHFQSVVNRVVSRRSILKAGLGLGAVAFLGGALGACGGATGSSSGRSPGTGSRPEPRLGFTAVPANSGHAVVVPQGYRAEVLAPWGAALFANSPAWREDGTNTGADQAMQVGDNHDGMHFFPIHGQSSREGLLVVNHEYSNNEYLFGADYMTPWTLDKVRKAQHAHGQSVLHIKKDATGKWDVVLDSPYNRRIHANTPMVLTGPAAGDALLVTGADLTGTSVYGTLNNCGNGHTPWGTYLAAEENFNGYFANGDAHQPPA
jgi:secreted PhoX family phosphatase